MIGGVRDLDVLRDQLVDARARLERDLARTLGPLDVELARARTHAHRELVAALAAPRCRRLIDRLTGFAQSPTPARPRRLGDLALGLVDPLLRTVLRRGRRAAAERTAIPLHRLRVAVKRLRYALETLEGLGGDRTRKLRRRLVRLQEVLGGYQDTVTGRAWLRRWAESAERLPRPTLMALGALIDVLARRSRKADRRFPRAWERLDRRKLRAGARDELAQARRRAETRVRVAAS
jgi:CHAD domain-containing protein